MFTPDFSSSAILIQNATQLAATTLSGNMKIASDIANANLNTSRKILESFLPQKKEETTQAFFPTPFHYFPNLYKTEEKQVTLPTPFQFMENVQPQANLSPFSFSDIFTKIMQNQGETITSPFGFFDHVKPALEQMRVNQSTPSIRGFMVFFDIPLKDLGMDNLPWANVPPFYNQLFNSK